MAFLVFFLGFTAFLSYSLTPQAIRLAASVGAVDLPDGIRKLQAEPVPKLGGVGIYLSFALCVAVAWISARLGFLQFCASSKLLFLQLVGGGGAVLVGAADDVFSYSAVKKLTLGALLSLVSALAMTDFSVFTAPSLYFLRVLGNSLFILLLMNAFNMLDGVDGLCATLSLVPLLFLSENSASLLLFFAVLGFLPHNLPAKIYLGESGAAFLGYFVAVTYLYGDSSSFAIFSLMPYTLEVLATILRRAARGRHPFSPDRGHLHHRLVRAGFTPHGVASLITLLSFITAALSRHK